MKVFKDTEIYFNNRKDTEVIMHHPLSSDSAPVIYNGPNINIYLGFDAKGASFPVLGI